MSGITDFAIKVYRAGQPEEAIKLLVRHLDFFPEDYQAAGVLGRFYREQKHPEKAIFWLKYSLDKRKKPKPIIENKPEELPEIGMDEMELYSVDGSTETRHEDSSLAVPVLESESFAEQEKDFKPAAPLTSQLSLDGILEAGGSQEGCTRTISTSLESKISKREEEQESELEPIEHYLNEEDKEAEGRVIDEIDESEDFFDGSNDFVDFDNDESVGLEDEFSEFEDIELESSSSNFTVPDWVDSSFFVDEDSDDEIDDLTNSDALIDELSVEDRARQFAAGIIAEVGWAKGDMSALVEILAHHKSHFRTRRALLELIKERDADVDELSMLYELRLLWRIDGFNRCYTATSTTEGRENLPWGLGLDILRHVQATCADEAFLFIDDCFQDWNNDYGLIDAYPYFTHYLYKVINLAEDSFLQGRYEVPLQFNSQILRQLDDNQFYAFPKNGVSYPPELQLQHVMENEEFDLL